MKLFKSALTLVVLLTAVSCSFSETDYVVKLQGLSQEDMSKIESLHANPIKSGIKFMSQSKDVEDSLWGMGVFMNVTSQKDGDILIVSLRERAPGRYLYKEVSDHLDVQDLLSRTRGEIYRELVMYKSNIVSIEGRTEWFSETGTNARDYNALKEFIVTDGGIGEECFAYCQSLESVSFLEFRGNLTIRSSSFEGCSNLREINNCKIKSVQDYSFKGCKSITDLPFAENLDYVGTGAFENCAALHGIDCQSIKEIGARAFRNCSVLEKFSASEVEKIGDSAFEDCSSLATVKMNVSVPKIPRRCFRNCRKLTDANIYPDEKRVGPLLCDSSAFEGCISLKNIPGDNDKMWIFNRHWFFNSSENFMGVSISISSELMILEDGYFRLVGNGVDERGTFRIVNNQIIANITKSDDMAHSAKKEICDIDFVNHNILLHTSRGVDRYR